MKNIEIGKDTELDRNASARQRIAEHIKVAVIVVPIEHKKI